MREIGLLALIFGLAVGPAVSVPVASEVVRGVAVEIRLDKAAYGVGEPVEIALTLTNTEYTVASFQFSTGQMFDFVVTHEGQRVWQWSLGRAFIQAFTTLTLNPRETETFTDRWDQRNAQGQQVASGVYELAAIFPVGGGGLAPMGSGGPRVQFTITASSMPSGPHQTPSVTSRAVTMDGPAGGDVLVDSRVAVRIRAAAGGFSAPRRAEIVAARLQRFLAQQLAPKEFVVAPAGAGAAIMWHQQLVVTIDPADAREAKKAPLVLAGEWLRALARALPAAP